MSSWDLEYMLLFGPPENKLELLGGRTPCSFPFLDRGVADAHFAAWAATLARWQEVADPPARMVDEASPPPARSLSARSRALDRHESPDPRPDRARD